MTTCGGRTSLEDRHNYDRCGVQPVRPSSLNSYTKGRPALGFIAVGPIVLVLLWVLGTMALLGIPYNMITALITALSIGIGVDYTIHIIHRYEEEFEHTRDPEAAARRTLGTTGSAPPARHHRLGTTGSAPPARHHRLGTTGSAPPARHHRLGASRLGADHRARLRGAGLLIADALPAVRHCHCDHHSLRAHCRRRGGAAVDDPVGRLSELPAAKRRRPRRAGAGRQSVSAWPRLDHSLNRQASR